MEGKPSTRLHNLSPSPGSRRPRKRVGRGRSAGGGKTCGRGTKGQKARSGYKTKPGFEGGQMPLLRRVPKLGGFTPRTRRRYSVVKLSDLSRFDAETVVDPESLFERGLVKKKESRIKILGNGEIDRVLTVKAHAFSKSAREKIEAAGGKVEVID